MSGLLWGMMKARVAVAPRRFALNQRAKISSKPPKDNIGAAESVFVLVVLGVTVLGPSGWILANLENYKKRD